MRTLSLLPGLSFATDARLREGLGPVRGLLGPDAGTPGRRRAVQAGPLWTGATYEARRDLGRNITAQMGSLPSTKRCFPRPGVVVVLMGSFLCFRELACPQGLGQKWNSGWN